MKKIIKTFLVFVLFSNLSISQINWNLDYQSANFAFLIVDFKTYNFEGGCFSKFPYQSGYDSVGIPFSIVYNPPIDYGNILFTYSAIGDTIFAADIWWAGQGQITFPDSIDVANQFNYDPTNSANPFSISYFNYMNVMEDSIFHQKADSSWTSIRKLSILKEFAKQGNIFRVGIYLYTPAVGVFNPAVAKWIVFLYRGQLIVGVEDENRVPQEYKLFQNFPNPFNPSTKISWQSPQGGRQTLKVYDILGMEVATLVDEYRPAGNYEINFDASKLPSGVYVYKFQSGSFVETKKMILMK